MNNASAKKAKRKNNKLKLVEDVTKDGELFSIEMDEDKTAKVIENDDETIVVLEFDENVANYGKMGFSVDKSLESKISATYENDFVYESDNKSHKETNIHGKEDLKISATVSTGPDVDAVNTSEVTNAIDDEDSYNSDRSHEVFQYIDAKPGDTNFCDFIGKTFIDVSVPDKDDFKHGKVVAVQRNIQEGETSHFFYLYYNHQRHKRAPNKNLIDADDSPFERTACVEFHCKKSDFRWTGIGGRHNK